MWWLRRPQRVIHTIFILLKPFREQWQCPVDSGAVILFLHSFISFFLSFVSPTSNTWSLLVLCGLNGKLPLGFRHNWLERLFIKSVSVFLSKFTRRTQKEHFSILVSSFVWYMTKKNPSNLWCVTDVFMLWGWYCLTAVMTNQTSSWKTIQPHFPLQQIVSTHTQTHTLFTSIRK